MTARLPVGIVGAGQLARMTCEAASALGLGVAVLAQGPDDAAAAIAPDLVIGSPKVAADLDALAARCEVITFDHEHVDLRLLADLEQRGRVVRPGTRTLDMAVDKGRMRLGLAAAGLPVPAFALLSAAGTPGRATPGTPAALTREVASFAADHGWPVVLKAARGGYDGKGVWPVHDAEEAARVCAAAAASGTPLLVEESVAIDAELAVLVARRPGGQTASWPAVETAQVDGMCREVLVPGRLPQAVVDRAGELAREVAGRCELAGVLAVELFLAGDRLLVNELAARPHNSGHWTIEGSVTSQFENHLRAVLDLPLGDTSPVAAAIASVNVLGADPPSEPARHLAAALAIQGAHVHLYGKVPRPGRKLGHVTVCGDDPADVRARAWAAAAALGTPVPDRLALVGTLR